MRDKKISDYHKRGLIEAVSILQPILFKDYGQQIPPELESFADVPAWQRAAAEKIIGVSFPGLRRSDLEVMTAIEAWGFMEGMLTALFSNVEASGLDLADYDGLYLPDLGQSPEEGIPERSESFLESLPVEIQSKYYTEFSRGFKKFSAVGEEFMSNDAQDLYMIMLIFRNDLRFLDSWKSLHKFVCQWLPQYENRMDSMRKSLNRIGFRLKAH